MGCPAGLRPTLLGFRSHDPPRQLSTKSLGSALRGVDQEHPPHLVDDLHVGGLADTIEVRRIRDRAP